MVSFGNGEGCCRERFPRGLGKKQSEGPGATEEMLERADWGWALCPRAMGHGQLQDFPGAGWGEELRVQGARPRGSGTWAQSQGRGSWGRVWEAAWSPPPPPVAADQLGYSLPSRAAQLARARWRLLMTCPVNQCFCKSKGVLRVRGMGQGGALSCGRGEFCLINELRFELSKVWHSL